jgi:hypothetical protein
MQQGQLTTTQLGNTGLDLELSDAEVAEIENRIGPGGTR